MSSRAQRVFVRLGALLLAIPGLFLGFGYTAIGLVYLSELIWLGLFGVVLGPSMVIGAYLLFVRAFLGRFPAWTAGRGQAATRTVAS